MWLRYNYRLYPTAEQRDMLARAFGCARTVFNDGLALRRRAEHDGLPFVVPALRERPRFLPGAGSRSIAGRGQESGFSGGLRETR
ncbi:helix-turn-helix domain-containing protein [Spirillospora sp. NPDC029432]|uniref:helix-turn-helix domain-containing protein n=1 Tax=Spirillospora sp. NPDC029432 TaxID=3154599 RepID=UPI0034533926